MTLDTGAKHSWLNRPTLDHNKRVLTIQQASAEVQTNEKTPQNIVKADFPYKKVGFYYLSSLQT